ncbi:hypothetical protein JTZ10_21695 [Gordonia rubripertincta]|uniref:Phage protein Gp19/Gp15/Gp42 n=1 Tax=Gordonia rubripertincta TaxID=36822 RepID=A0AAW4GBF5_GORRU|nr:Gp19/Gp15/Gp42 family protein [Gordonia rubripertincta]MBM7280362.1 hypothetical protein [Gordonia rubripertincta]
MSAYATADDLAARWKNLSGAEMGRAEVLLQDAAVWLRTWFGDLDSRIAAGTLDAQAPLMVSCAMVRRAMLNAEGDGTAAYQRTDSAGPMSMTENRTYSNPEGNLYLTAREVDLLAGHPASAGSFTSPGF